MREKKEFLSLIFTFLIASLIPALLSATTHKQEKPSPPIYDYIKETSWISMKDGVRLSATFYKPVPRSPGEKFPVLLEFLPYRKDDPRANDDSETYIYFVRRGYIVARVDIRGTGSSEGEVPLHEYSEQELDDAVEIIDQLSKMLESNGRVGMWGISWGGFNAIQVAMRQPPALKAILATDASDDLYHDDIHYIDGCFHVDAYMPSFDHSKGLPQTPNWQLDEAYFKHRFNSYPMLLTYLKNQLDGEFWRKNSLRWHYDKIRIPVYLIGGLLDGYRDCIPRMLKNMKVPIIAVIGPWGHAYPHDINLTAGPFYEWRHDAVRWWDHWLKDHDTGILKDPRFTVFVREGHAPDPYLKMTPGHWICDDWPMHGTQWKKFYPAEYRQLKSQPVKPTAESLRYVPGYGTATTGTTTPAEVNWWGDPTGDIRPDDAGSLIFDSPLIEESFEIVGFPQVYLRVSADVPLAHWVARLEDVQSDGTVSLVTGAVLNGSQRNSRLKPESLVPGEIYDLSFNLHFTTWTFQEGHRIRLAVSNALFPMIWPTPYPMTTKLFIGIENTCLELPVVTSSEYKTPTFKPLEPSKERKSKTTDFKTAKNHEKHPNVAYYQAYFWPDSYKQHHDMYANVSVEWKGSGDLEIQGRHLRSFTRDYFQTNGDKPAESCYHGERGKRIELEGRTLDLHTIIDLHSDEKNFYVTFIRQLFENGKLVRRKEWKETITRQFQ